jgi:hypothetical protein
LEIAGVGGGAKDFTFSGKKIALDLLLDQKRIPGKFGCNDTYCVEMHKEQANGQTNSLLYILED